jgi:hypothetical protein
MKSTLRCIFYLLILNVILNFNCEANWVLYDDFNSSTQIDNDKWEMKLPNGSFNIENGKAKLVQYSGSPGVWNSILLKQNVGTIKGVRAKILVTDCSSAVEVRMMSIIGNIGQDNLFCKFSLRPQYEDFAPSLTVISNFNTKSSYFWGHFKRPADVIGTQHTLSIDYSRKEINYSTDSYGDIHLYFPSEIERPDVYYTGIGTTGNGSCTVLFDDVYVNKDISQNNSSILLLLE